MKIAILTYGEYRTADVATKSWNVFDTNHDIDVYVHTQTESVEQNDNFMFKKSINKSDVEKLFPKSKIWLEKRDEYKNDTEPRDIHLNFRSYRFLFEKLKESKINYDFVIVNRLDTILCIRNIDLFLKEHNKKALYTMNPRITYENPFIQDHFFMGSYNVVYKFLENLPHPSYMISSHHDFGKYILDSKVEREEVDLISFHLRQNQIEILNKTLKEGSLETLFQSGDLMDSFLSQLSELEDSYKPPTK